MPASSAVHPGHLWEQRSRPKKNKDTIRLGSTIVIYFVFVVVYNHYRHLTPFNIISYQPVIFVMIHDQS